MKSAIVIVALGLLLTPSHADTNEKTNTEPSLDKNAKENVYIDNAHSTIYIDIKDGKKSWSVVWNYKTGYLASRSYDKKVCFISTINKDLMPDVAAIIKGLKGQSIPPKEITQIISKDVVRDLQAYGNSIHALCKGVPTYTTHETHGSQFWYGQGSCLRLNVLVLLGLNYCSGVNSS